MVVDGVPYTKDLMLHPDGRIEGSWWRRDGHTLTMEDIAGLVCSSPEILVAGTGAGGMMQPERGLESSLAARGVELLCLPTAEAVEVFNRTAAQKRTAACFHLTC